MKHKLNVKERLINVKKEHTCDKGKQSKVLALCATQEIAEQVDAQLSEIKSARHRHVSCKKTSSDSRLASMHYDDVVNKKA